MKTLKTLASLLFLYSLSVTSNTAIASNYFYVIAKHSGKCLHQHGGTTGNGDPITQWECVNQPNVLWKLRPAP